jgi:hypothetical protein
MTSTPMGQMQPTHGPVFNTPPSVSLWILLVSLKSLSQREDREKKTLAYMTMNRDAAHCSHTPCAVRPYRLKHIHARTNARDGHLFFLLGGGGSTTEGNGDCDGSNQKPERAAYNEERRWPDG